MVLSTTSIQFTITDGEDFVCTVHQLPQAWATLAQAEEVMQRLCWHPRRYAGPFRVEPVSVETSRWGTVLAVTRLAAP